MALQVFDYSHGFVMDQWAPTRWRRDLGVEFPQHLNGHHKITWFLR